MIITTDQVFDKKVYRRATHHELSSFMQSPIEGEVGNFTTVKDWVWYILTCIEDCDTEDSDTVLPGNRNPSAAKLSEDEEIAADIDELLGEHGDRPTGLFILCEEGVMDFFGEIITNSGALVISAIAITRIDGASITDNPDQKYNCENTNPYEYDDCNEADWWKK